MRKMTGLIVLVLVASACVTVDEGEVVVPTQFGEVQEPITESGIHSFNFITRNAHSFPLRAQEIVFNQNEDTNPPIQALSAEGARIDVDVSIWWHVNPDLAGAVYARLGTNQPAVEEKIVSQTRSKARDCLPRFEFEDARTSARIEAQKCILEILNETLGPLGIIIDDVLLREMRADAALQQAIDDKLQAQNDVKEAEFRQQQQQVENRTNIERARAEAEAQIIQAQAEADALRIAASAEAEANDMIGRSLTPDLLELLVAQAYADSDATLFLGGGGEMQPRIDVP